MPYFLAAPEGEDYSQSMKFGADGQENRQGFDTGPSYREKTSNLALTMQRVGEDGMGGEIWKRID